jgi:hypothetical protein
MCTPGRASVVTWAVIATITGCSSVFGASVRTQQPDAAVQRLVDDYIGLYRKETLEEWKALFLPGFVASYTNDDGSVTSRTLEEFYDRQRNAFAKGDVSETLANVRSERLGRLAHVSADFTFISGGKGRPGRLMLLMLESGGQLKIAALTFTYHLAP